MSAHIHHRPSKSLDPYYYPRLLPLLTVSSGAGIADNLAPIGRHLKKSYICDMLVRAIEDSYIRLIDNMIGKYRSLITARLNG
jgi:hypothetical protein